MRDLAATKNISLVEHCRLKPEAYLQKLVPTIGSDVSVPGAVARLQPSGATLFAVRSENLKSTTSAQRGLMLDHTPIAGVAHDISAIVPQATGLFSANSVAGDRP